MRLLGVLVTMAIAVFSVHDGAAQGVANVDERRLRGLAVMAPMPDFTNVMLLVR